MKNPALLIIAVSAVALLAMRKASAAPVETSADAQQSPGASSFAQSFTDSTGTYRLIRPQGAPNEYGAFDIALWAKAGVDETQTVYMRSIGGMMLPIPA